MSDLTSPVEGERAARTGAQGRRGWGPVRTGSVATLIVLAVLAAACGSNRSSDSNGAGGRSTSLSSGSPWIGPLVAVVPPEPLNAFTDVTCATGSRCWAVGSTVGGSDAPNGAAVIATTNGGVTWKTQAIPPQIGYLSRISCSSPKDCTAVGQAAQTSNGQGAAIETIDGGSTWTLATVPADILDLSAVACPSRGRCLAVGTTASGAVALAANADGSSWQEVGALPAGETGPTAISCVDDLECWVTATTMVNADHVAGAVAVTTDGGVAWAATTTPKGLGALDGLSCLQGPTTGSGALPTTTIAPPVTTTAPTTTASTATASGASSTTPTTATPQSTTTTPPPTAAAPVVGVAGVECVVVGTTDPDLGSTRSGHGALLTTANGGAAWTDRTVSAHAAALTDVSCPVLGTCLAVGVGTPGSPSAGIIALSGSAGSPWKAPLTVVSPQSLTAASCTSTSSCVVVGEAITEHLGGSRGSGSSIP